MVHPCRFMVMATAGSFFVVIVVAAGVVVIVIIVFLKYLKFELSPEKVKRFIENLEMRETGNATSGLRQKEQILKLLREILKGGKRIESLKAEMLSTIMDEVGNEVTDWESQSTHLESTSFISGQQPSTEARGNCSN